MSEPVSKLGRKEILTEELARKIARMVSLFPDSQIPVTWENVMTHSKKKFGHAFNRQMLSQKEWCGRKLIAEAFSEAKNIQRRMQNDIAPKYKTAARSVLQKKIGELEAKNLALREELEMVRAQQVDKLDVFLNSTSREIDLRKLLDTFYETQK
ncbi:hypothetical protein ACUVMQ_03455 [Aeromonas veronii]|uniref:hypothetical protein n=1 Tax=Aeromonas veronii TaxID=654 RepID=UPI0040557439